MTYLQITDILTTLCSSLPNVNTVAREFLSLNREDTLYSAMVIQDRDGARTDNTYQSYNDFSFYIGYVDRLTPDKSNADDIVSTGITHINTLITSLEELDITVSSSSLISFTQRFTAECAGVYLGITLSVPVDCTIPAIHIGNCKVEPREESITTNGSFTFIPEGETIGFSKFTVDVDVPFKPEKELTDSITTNGQHTYTPDEGEVYKSAVITTDIHPTDTLNKTITSNGSFSYPGEWNGAEITVNVPTSSFTDIPGMKYGYSGQLPDGYAISPRTFYQCGRMFYHYLGTTIPAFDTSSCIDFTQMMEDSHIKSLPSLDFGKAVYMDSAFNKSGYLTDIPVMDLRNAQYCRYAFAETAIKSIELTFNPTDRDPEYIQTTDVDVDHMFSQCYDLETIIIHNINSAYNLTTMFAPYNINFTEFLIDGNLNSSIDVGTCHLLSYDSIKSILTSGSASVISPVTPLTMQFCAQTVTDRDGEIAALVSTCVSRGWTITGLTIS